MRDDGIFQTMKMAALALLVCTVATQAAVIRVDGTFTSYTTVLSTADPYSIGLPETYSVVLNTSGSAIVDGTPTFTGGSGKQFALTGGTLNVGTTTDFTGIQLPTYGGAIGGTVNLSVNASISDFTQTSLDTLIGKAGAGSLFGFPFTNGARGLYQGAMTVVAIPEPATLATLALPLLTLMRRRRA